MYPVDRGEREGEFHLIVDPSMCLGMKEKRQWKVREYLYDQGLDPYNEMEKPFRKITTHPRFSQEKIQNPKIQEMCRMALYDLNRFRRFVLESRFLEVFHVDKEVVDRLKEDDLELMKLAYRWVEFGLISGETLKIREDIIKGGRDKGREFLNNLKLMCVAVSLGSVNTLIEHPASMTHSTYTQEELAEAGIPEGLIRLSVGIENVEDLIEDIEHAMNKSFS